MSRLISRAPFARTELRAERVYSESASCRWCGNKLTTPTGRHYLYNYVTEGDSGDVATTAENFCTISCMRNYYA